MRRAPRLRHQRQGNGLLGHGDDALSMFCMMGRVVEFPIHGTWTTLTLLGPIDGEKSYGASLLSFSSQGIVERDISPPCKLKCYSLQFKLL